MKKTSTVRPAKKSPPAKVVLDGDSLTIKEIISLTESESKEVSIAPRARKHIKETRAFIDKESQKRPIYGVNTGFGPMVTQIIGTKKLTDLQYNLLRGHAVGIGDPVDDRFVLAAMIVRLNTLAKGYSGVSESLIDTVAALINHRITPIVPEHGAVGTSGDLVQLAHIAIALIGEGEAFHQEKRQKVKTLLKRLGISAHELKPKEGLSLINGTSMMTGIGAVLTHDADRAINIATQNAATAFELVAAFSDTISPKLQEVRGHKGQKEIAAHMRALLKDSKRLRNREKDAKAVSLEKETYTTEILLQEVYSMRCTPQVLGPVKEAIAHTKQVVEVEMNAVTDNPIVDLGSDIVLHGGNFHGDYVATAIDQLKTSLIKMTLLSERRVNFFLNKSVNKTFPPFLNLVEPGLTMGLQGLQFVATSTAAQSQSLGYPHSLHSIPTNGDNQDIVSMGTDAALIANKVIQNAFVLLAIEMVTLAQAADTLEVDASEFSSKTQEMLRQVRMYVPSVKKDRESLTHELEALTDALIDGAWEI